MISSQCSWPPLDKYYYPNSNSLLGTLLHNALVFTHFFSDYVLVVIPEAEIKLYDHMCNNTLAHIPVSNVNDNFCFNIFFLLLKYCLTKVKATKSHFKIFYFDKKNLTFVVISQEVTTRVRPWGILFCHERLCYDMIMFQLEGFLPVVG